MVYAVVIGIIVKQGGFHGPKQSTTGYGVELLVLALLLLDFCHFRRNTSYTNSGIIHKREETAHKARIC